MPEQRSRPRDGRVIALANQKGGTGKTLSLIHILPLTAIRKNEKGSEIVFGKTK